MPAGLFNRFFVLLWVETLALQMGQNIFNNLISVYAVSLGYSNTFAGSLAIPYMILAVAGRLYGGYVADTRSRRTAMWVGCAAFAVGSVAYLVPALAVPVALLLFRGLHGFGYAAASTAYSAAVVDVTPRERLALGVGVNWTAQGVAQLLGGVVTVALVFGTNYSPVFLCAALFCALGTAAALLCDYEKGRAPAERAPRPAASRLRLSDLVERKALPNAAVVLVYYLGIAVGTFYTVSLAAERGIAGGGLFFTASALGMIVSNVCLVKLADRFGRLAVLLPVFTVAAVCDVCLAVTGSFSVLLLAGVLYGVAIGAMPVFQSATVEHLPPERRGAGTSTLFLAMDLSMGVGPVLWGAVIDLEGFTAAYLGAAVLTVAAAVLLVIVFRRRTGER